MNKKSYEASKKNARGEINGKPLKSRYCLIIKATAMGILQ